MLPKESVKITWTIRDPFLSPPLPLTADLIYISLFKTTFCSAVASFRIRLLATKTKDARQQSCEANQMLWKDSAGRKKIFVHDLFRFAVQSSIAETTEVWRLVWKYLWILSTKSSWLLNLHKTLISQCSVGQVLVSGKYKIFLSSL